MKIKALTIALLGCSVLVGCHKPLTTTVRCQYLQPTPADALQTFDIKPGILINKDSYMVFIMPPQHNYSYTDCVVEHSSLHPSDHFLEVDHCKEGDITIRYRTTLVKP